MKKLLCVLLISLLTVACFTACGATSEEPTEPAAPTESTDTVSAEFADFMQGIYDAQPGSAGGEEKTAEAAKKFVDYTVANGENITVGQIEAAAELFLQEKAAEDENYIENFKQAFTAVKEAARAANPDLETDVNYLKYENGIQNALDNL